MPNTIRLETLFLGNNATPDTMNTLPPTALTGGGVPPGSNFPYAAGEVGGSFDLNNRTYSLVQNDSGATSATPTGAVVANQVAFWKDKSAGIVTNDKRFALNGTITNAAGNAIAGIYRVAASAGAIICILSRGQNIAVASDGSGGGGQTAVVDTTVSTARVTPVAIGTAPTYMTVGIMRSTPTGGNVNVDVDIPTLP